MNYQVIRSDRKTICLKITPEGEVLVRAPRRCAEAYIRGFVEDHMEWILRNQAIVRSRNADRDQFCLSQGDHISLCGSDFEIRIVPGLSAAVLRDQIILPSGEGSRERKAILSLAKKNGMPFLRARLGFWASRMGISYQDVKISTARNRWGCCSRDGVIRISVFLLFAPARAIDYVLIHELAHRRQFDHSSAFWRIVSAAMPDWKEQRAVLKRFQAEPLVQFLAEKDA
ncbi:MAG: M48 family metallopeptidase [Oscillospiraceae bacterium]|nr:M48 family metallopeptidase [Oscillospiraceae bacterium]